MIQRKRITQVIMTTSCVFRPWTERIIASEQPRNAQPIDTRNIPNRASGSIPPIKLARASTGSVQAIRPSTGIIRTPSFPRTISAFERSVASMWSRVPRALSRQMAPAVAAGAASRISVSSIIAIARYVCSPFAAISRSETSEPPTGRARSVRTGTRPTRITATKTARSA